MALLRVLAVAALLGTACSSVGGADDPADGETTATTGSPGPATAGAPPAPEPLEPEVTAAIDGAVSDAARFIGEPLYQLDPDRYEGLAVADPRTGWVIVDLGQFVFRGEAVQGLISSAELLTGEDLTIRTFWKQLGDHLITNDVPAPPGLLDWKRQLYGAADTAFIRLLDPDADVDWRHVSFGGVLPDTRPYRSTEGCSCIRALDEPPSAPADEIDWYPDERPVLGIEVGGEHRAYPVNVMEVHELVNDELGGRPVTLSYCTLCRSAVAHLLDELPDGIERPVLRTSGLLERSNKLMFDLTTYSLIDQFTGEALSGPLAEAGVVLPRVTVVTSSWGAWREAHPDTTFMTGRDGSGASYPENPLGERDAAGPIFPVGAVADDLPPRGLVVGTVLDDGSTVAFAVDELRAAFEAGLPVEHAGVVVVADGDGFRLVDDRGADLQSTEANWFAWSQQFPTTDLWLP